MTSLETYLRGPHREDGVFRERLLKTIREVVPIFYKKTHALRVSNKAKTTHIDVTTWPYSVTDGPAAGDAKYSASTHCMILFALDGFVPRAKDRYSFLIGPSFRPCKLSGAAVDKGKVQVTARNNLIDVVKQSDPTDLVMSGTYGKNDPFTLTWLTEIAYRWPEDLKALSDDAKAVFNTILNAADKALCRDTILDPEGAEGKFREITGSFLKVRRLHLARATARLAKVAQIDLDKTKWPNETELWREFDSTVHRQLSYSSMKDPKFDPAELAFAFEGALLLHSSWVSRSTADQVFKALTLSKDRKPFWRPVTPFLANERGQVLFLVSVEVANSILRSCELLDENEVVPTWFARVEPQLRTYATWLLGEAERIPAPDPKVKNLVGWRTEYAEKRGTIHLWHTSHVLLFLAHYESFLKRKIAADGAEAAGLSVRFPKQIEDYWNDSEPLRATAKTGGQYAVLSRLQARFIEPRMKPGVRRDDPHSVLLYGPPGTGKTTVAEQMAERLGYPLIVITVSDFLAAGSGELENRAKGVFEVLRSQEGVVILFDEIDQFLLDRNSKHYEGQDTVFKFMTPGMLTKLQDLRDNAGCVFLIATNYYERVDNAIKRRGRIDDHLLLSLPDREQRLFLLGKFVRELFKEQFEDAAMRDKYKSAAPAGPALAFFTALSEGNLPPDFQSQLVDWKVPEKTVFFGWGDLKSVVGSTTVKDAVKEGMTMAPLAEALAKAAGELEPAVSLGAYLNRFDGKSLPPYEEFFLLVYLVAESGRPFEEPEKEAIKEVLKGVKNLKPATLRLLQDQGYIKEQAIFNKLAPLLKSLIT